MLEPPLDGETSKSIVKRLIWVNIAAGIFFRSYNLLERGPFKGDGIDLWRTVTVAVQEQVYLWYHAKPGHIFLLWLFSLPLGLKPYVPVLVSLLTGMGTVILTYYLGRKLFSHETGLVSAALLIINPWHVEYSREALSLANASFFWMLALIYYLKSRPDSFCHTKSRIALIESQGPRYLYKVVISGIYMGFAFSCHYNLGLMPVAFLLFEVHLGYKILIEKKNGSTFELEKKHFDDENSGFWVLGYAIRIFLLLMSMLFPLVFFNSLHLHLVYLNYSNIIGDPAEAPVIFSYAQQIINQLKTNVSIIWGHPSGAAFWGRILWNDLGGIACMLFIAGLVIQLKRLKKNFSINYLAFVLPIFLAFVFFLNGEYKGEARSFAFGIPLTALVSGYCLTSIGRFKKFKSYYLIIPFFIFVQNIPILISQIQINSVREQVQSYLRDNNIKSIIMQGWEARSMVNLSPKQAIFSPNSKWTYQQVKTARRSGKNVNPRHLLTIRSQMDCQPIASWIPTQGRSEKNFERGKVFRTWDLRKDLNLKNEIGLFLIENCFIKNNNQVPGNKLQRLREIYKK
tara:strand:+ start:1810 stop:3516 length:1707 start_codon:yes stop_codon:yes gene_type:complete